MRINWNRFWEEAEDYLVYQDDDPEHSLDSGYSVFDHLSMTDEEFEAYMDEKFKHPMPDQDSARWSGIGLSAYECFNHGVYMCRFGYAGIEKAIHSFTRAIAEVYSDTAIEFNNPKLCETLKLLSINAFYYRGRLKFLIANYQGAIDDFSEVIYLRSTYVNAYIERGKALRRLNMYEEALRDFEFTLSVKSSDITARQEKATLLNLLSTK